MADTSHRAIAAVLWAWLIVPTAARPDGRAIDAARSSIHVHVFKSGLFSAFAHNHDVQAPIDSSEVTEAGTPFVELRVDAQKLRVLDPEVFADTRAEVQKTMQGPQVFDAERYPEIHFRSTKVQPTGADHWLVTGDLELAWPNSSRRIPFPYPVPLTPLGYSILPFHFCFSHDTGTEWNF